MILGGTFLVNGGMTLAQSVGISETVIELTIVAVGTSLSELVSDGAGDKRFIFGGRSGGYSGQRTPYDRPGHQRASSIAVERAPLLALRSDRI